MEASTTVVFKTVSLMTSQANAITAATDTTQMLTERQIFRIRSFCSACV